MGVSTLDNARRLMSSVGVILCFYYFLRGMIPRWSRGALWILPFSTQTLYLGKRQWKGFWWSTAHEKVEGRAWRAEMTGVRATRWALAGSWLVPGHGGLIHRLVCFNTPSPAGGAVWGDYRAFRRWSLTGGSGCSPTLHPVYSLLPGCECNVTSSLLLPMLCFSHHN